MTSRQLMLMAGLGSAALLASAFFFQVIGYPPCKMCLWQRWPHAAAILIGLIGYRYGAAAIAYLGALATFITGAIGAYHTGVEKKWWEGPSSCSGGGNLGTDLLSTDITPVVMCDEISWQFLGLSMASYNMLAAFALTIVWLAAARRTAG